MNEEHLLKIMDSKMEELKCYFRLIVRNEIENIISTNDLLKRLEKERYEENQLCSYAVKLEKNTGLSFEEAIVLWKKNKKIKRSVWPHWDILHISEKGIERYALQPQDYLANDWEIVE